MYKTFRFHKNLHCFKLLKGEMSLVFLECIIFCWKHWITEDSGRAYLLFVQKSAFFWNDFQKGIILQNQYFYGDTKTILLDCHKFPV